MLYKEKNYIIEMLLDKVKSYIKYKSKELEKKFIINKR